MTANKSKGTPLQVFSGKEEALNRLILLILHASKQPLIKYDVALKVRQVKKSRHMDKNIVFRRMDALRKINMIDIVGERPTQPGWASELYAITERGKTALKLDKRNIEEFLLTADYEELHKFNDAYP